jgi:tetratricopeptide (TPR) repeat protein
VAAVLIVGAGIIVLSVVQHVWRRDTPWTASREIPGRQRDTDDPRLVDGPVVPGPSPVPSEHPEIAALIEEAGAVGRQLCERFPGDLRALGLAAQIQQRFGNANAALALWEEILRLDADCVEAYCGIGAILSEQGQNEPAELALREAFRRDSSSPQIAILLANALLNQGQAEEALAILERHAEHGAASMPHLMLQGQACLQLKQYEQAKRHFQSVIQVAPEFSNAYYGLATACTRLGQRDEAVATSKRFKALQTRELRARIDESSSYDDLRTTRQQVADICVSAGRLYRAYGDDQAAEDRWLRAAEVDPENADSRIDLVQLFLQANRQIPRAIELAREAIQLRPTPNCYFLLAVACERAGDVRSAAEAIEQALRLEPGNPQYRQMQQLLRERL